jgi:N-methylhydantoinase B
LNGGKCGAASVNELDGQLVPSKITEVMKRGQVFRHQLAGGGGHGDPNTRETAKVLHDVLEGMVSIEAAHLDYGVVIDPDTMTVDEESTKRVRREMAQSAE